MNSDYEKGGTQKDTYESSEVVTTVCPLCGKSDFKQVYRERGALGIVKCLACNLIYVNPRLKNPEKIYWGDATKYFQESRLIFEGKAVHHRDANYNKDLRLIYKFKSSGKFLDIGTNMGFFLNTAKKMNFWDVCGVEPSPSLSEMAKKYFGLNIRNAFLENAGFESASFDVITMTDVFEHIANPDVILAETKRILRKEGILFIKVPNGLFNEFKLFSAGKLGKLKDYDIFDSYEHVVHYSGDTLKKMLEKCGFRIVYLSIGSPIQLPVWHKYVGHYYQYRTPWIFDYKRQTARTILYFLSKVEYYLRAGNPGYLAPNIIAIAKKRSSNK